MGRLPLDGVRVLDLSRLLPGPYATLCVPLLLKLYVGLLGEAGAPLTMGAVFAPLLAMLDRYAAQGRAATLWWRDDDASETSPALDRLLAPSAAHDVPLALAVVPAGAGEALAERLRKASSRVGVLQHG